MGVKGYEKYKRMLNLGWKSSWATGFEGNFSSCDNDNRIKVDWMVCHSYCKDLHQRLLP